MFLSAALLALAPPAQAQDDDTGDSGDRQRTDEGSEATGGDWGDDDWGDDDWGDGDDVGFADPTPAAEVEEISPWSIGGFLRTQEALWVERLDSEPLGLARQTGELTLRYSEGALRAVATVHGEVDPYYLSTDSYEPATRDNYGWLVQPRELWVGGAVGPLDISAGRQVVTWGEGLIISPVDRVNARDLRDPGVTEISDLRLPVTMLRLQAFLGDHRIELMGVPESDFGLRSDPEGPYGYIPGVAARAEVPEFIDVDEILDRVDTSYEHLQERWDLSQTQAFARWSWRGPGVDLALYGARVMDKQGVFATPNPNPELLDPELTELAIPLDHQPYWFAGLSGSAVINSLVIRWEGAGEFGRLYNIGDLVATTSTGANIYALSTEKTVYTGMVGLGYTGLKRTRIDAEFSKGHVVDGTANLLFPVGAAQYALRVSHTLLRERLELAVLGGGVGWTLENGWLVTGTGTYELADGLHAGLGYVTYQPGEELGPLVGFDTHDRLFATVRWDF